MSANHIPINNVRLSSLMFFRTDGFAKISDWTMPFDHVIILKPAKIKKITELVTRDNAETIFEFNYSYFCVNRYSTL